MMRTGCALLLALAACSAREPGEATGAGAAARAGEAAGAGAERAPAAPSHRVLPTAADALRAILDRPAASAPRVLGVGEYHQTRATAGVPSALSRFTAELLPALSGRVTDLVIESWAEPAGCGAEAAQASAEVTRDMDRPPATEDQLVTLVERARALRIRPHLLAFGCDDYRALRDPGGDVDYEQLLLAVTERLRARAVDGLAHERAVIALYGGALHNDLRPRPGVTDFSYAPDVDRRAGGRYVEIDLVVPEYVTGDPTLAREPWYPLLARAAADHVILIERAPRSYVLILRRSP